MPLSAWEERNSERREELATKRAKVLITYRSNLADDSLKMRRAALRGAQKERGETIYSSKVSRTPISASLNVYYRLLASEPRLAALLTAFLSLPSYLTPLLFLFYSRSTSHSVLHISSMSSNLSLFLSARRFNLVPRNPRCLYQRITPQYIPLCCPCFSDQQQLSVSVFFKILLFISLAAPPPP